MRRRAHLFHEIPIDVLFLSKQKKVLKVRHRMPAWKIALSFRAHSVLELPAGTAESTGTEVGDVLSFENYQS